MNPRLFDISWRVDEPTYRADEALSYSTIARYAREGFNKLDNLFDKLETPSLTFGKAVDALITASQEEFDKEFMVADFPLIADSIVVVVKDLFREFQITHRTLESIPDVEVIRVAASFNYQNNWKPETRAKVIKEKGAEYYSLMYAANGRTILDTTTMEQVDRAVEALKTSEATKFYFSPNNPFNDRYVREYQLKFKATLGGIDYRCMADLILCDYEKKHITLVDLKTSHNNEWDFCKSFVSWHYFTQARLYYRIIETNLKKDPFFKDFTISNYYFIVVNKHSLTPLVWEYEDTKLYGDLVYGKNKDIIVRDPENIGKELKSYLDSPRRVPIGIDEVGINSITKFLNEM